MNSTLSFPSGPGSREWLERLVSSDGVIQTFPFYLGDDEHIEVIGLTLLRNEDLLTVYFSLEGWKFLKRYRLKNEPFIHDTDVATGSASFVGKDVQGVERLVGGLAEKLNEDYGIGFVPFCDVEVDPQFLEHRDSCVCSGVSDSIVQTIDESNNLENTPELRCRQCFKLYGVLHQGKKIPLGKILDVDWHFKGSSPDDFLEIGRDSAFLLYSEGEPVGKTECAIASMCSLGGERSNSFSPYNPREHEALVFVQDGELCAYLSWDELDDIQILRQLFVREEYRRQGIAETLISTWCQRFCDSEVYYLDKPNDKSRNLFKKLGHLDGENGLLAKEIYPVWGVGNDIDEGYDLPG